MDLEQLLTDAPPIHGDITHALTFHAEKSEVVLPSLELDPLDFALIDGSHSFPQVFIDWFYLADALKIGSTLIVDDIYVWTGRVLCDFLDAEPGWTAETELQGRSAVFTKRGDAGLNRMWLDQPYVARKTGFGKPLNKARQAASMVRHGQGADLVAELRRKTGR